MHIPIPSDEYKKYLIIWYIQIDLASVHVKQSYIDVMDIYSKALLEGKKPIVWSVECSTKLLGKLD